MLSLLVQWILPTPTDESFNTWTSPPSPTSTLRFTMFFFFHVRWSTAAQLVHFMAGPAPSLDPTPLAQATLPSLKTALLATKAPLSWVLLLRSRSEECLNEEHVIQVKDKQSPGVDGA